MDKQDPFSNHNARDSGHPYEYKHFLVEVRFDGHPASTTSEIIIRKNLQSADEFRPDYFGDHHGVNFNQKSKADVQECFFFVSKVKLGI